MLDLTKPNDRLRDPRLIYLLNATLLLCHEMDSAYWREWELFGLPGGATFFVLLHLPIVGLVLWGLTLITREHAHWRLFSLGLGIAGVGGGLLHAWFLFAGSDSFSTVFSKSLIAAFLTVSVMQLIVTLVWWNALQTDQ